MRLRGPAAISPTAHYTGDTWARHGLGDPGLATLEGRVLHHALAPGMRVSAALGGPTLEGLLLARHRVMDHLLEQAVVAGTVGGVVELAAGLSPRGLAFTRRHPGLVYVETDLPGMLARKRRALERLGPRAPGHRLAVLDAVDGDWGPVLAELPRDRGLAVVSEGLLNYLPPTVVTALWHRIAAAAAAFPSGLHLSDLHLGGEGAGAVDAAFAALLGVFVRGRVHLHFARAADAEAALRGAGFATAVLHRPATFARELDGVDRPGSERVRVVAATT